MCVIVQVAHQNLQTELEKTANTSNQAADQPDFPDPHILQRVSLGYDHLLADCWWLAFIQYIGDGSARRKDHNAKAFDYLDIITTLDPNLTEAYSFAAFTIGAEQGKPDIADKLIRRGFKANSCGWYVPFIAGVNQYLYAHNDKAAAQYYRMASKYPHAPDWLSRQATILEREIPAIIKQINTWNNIYQTNDVGPVKDRAKEQLITLWLKVLDESPTPLIKARAKQELNALGVNLPD